VAAHARPRACGPGAAGRAGSGRPAPPPAARPELEADLGRLVTLARAERAAGFAAALPAALGPPDRVRLGARRISLVYAPRPGLPPLAGVDAGLIVTESRGGIRGQYLRKLLLGGTDVEGSTSARAAARSSREGSTPTST